jgi:hypothetical protein
VSRYVRSGGKVVKRPRGAPVTWRFWLTPYVIGAAFDWRICHIEQIAYVQVLAVFALVIAGCVMWLRRQEREARKEEHGDGEGQPTAVAHLPSTDEVQGLKEGERCW